MLIFGGDGPVTLNDTWALTLGPEPAWTEIVTDGLLPSPRSWHSAVFDSARDRMVVFGGFRFPGPSTDEAWALSFGPGEPEWLPIAAEGSPGGHFNHTAIYDPSGDRMVIFAGCCYRNDPWMLTFRERPSWSLVQTTGALPTPRYQHSAVYDPIGDRMVVFGGSATASPRLNDTWVLSLGHDAPEWTQLFTPPILPRGRAGHSIVFDPVKARLLLFAGAVFNGEDFVSTNDLWELPLADSAVWRQLSPHGSPPAARAGHTAIYDRRRDRMVVFGGSGLNDAWALSLDGHTSWTPLAPSGTPPAVREYHSAIYDPIADRMIVFGGLSGAASMQDLWALSMGDPPRWEQLNAGGDWPSARFGHSAVYDDKGDRMLVFGGSDGSASRDDVWALSLDGTLAWSELRPADPRPSRRAAHGAIYDPPRNRMVVFGGASASAYLNDTWALSLGDVPLWGQLGPGGFAPVPRSFFGTAYDADRERMIIQGGCCVSFFPLDDSHSLTWFVGIGREDEDLQAKSGSAAPDDGAGITRLEQPEPNPTGSESLLRFTLAADCRARLEILDASGRLVRALVDSPMSSGPHAVRWDGKDGAQSPTASGVYFARLQTAEGAFVRRIVRLTGR